MAELPTRPESLISDEPQTYEFSGPVSSEGFTIKGPSSSLANGHDHDSWTRSMMINVLIPIGLLAAAVALVLILGTAETEQHVGADNTRTGRLRSLPAVRVDRVQSLKSNGNQLQLKVDGTVVPYREVQIAAEVAGRIVYKAEECEAGSYVRQDQLLMRIDATDYELEVQRLTRMQEQEYQALKEVDQEMVNAKRLIDVAKRDVALQQREVDRQKSLPAGFASRGEVDQAERGLLQAEQQQVVSQNQFDLLEKRRVRLEASERLAATQLRGAEINLARTEIRAPMDGVIVNEDAEMNTFVARGNTLVTIEDTSKVEVATNLRMDQLYWVLDQERKESDESSRGYELPETPAIIEYELAGHDGIVYRWNGRLLSYDGIGLDVNTRTVPVRVVVDDPRQYLDEDGVLQAVKGKTALVRGMYVNVKLLIRPKTPLVVIPARALKPGNRVWQFVPDESVLNVPAASEDTTEQTSESSSEGQANSNEPNDASPFDPSLWSPGRVIVRRSVTPVDSLAVESETESDANAEDYATRFDTENRMWVCEVRGQPLVDGSFVVVSPLGSVDTESIAARAKSDEIAQPSLKPKVTTETVPGSAGSESAQ